MRFKSPDPFRHTDFEWWFYWRFLQPFNKGIKYGLVNLLKHFWLIKHDVQTGLTMSRKQKSNYPLGVLELQQLAEQLSEVVLETRGQMYATGKKLEVHTEHIKIACRNTKSGETLIVLATKNL